LDELLGRANLKPIIFLDTVDAAIDAQTRGHIGEFIFFLEKIVRYFRMLATDSELLRTLGTFHFDEDPTNYLRAVERCFEEDGFEVEQVDRNELNVQITARFHKIIEFGDTLKIRIVTEPLDEFSFDWIEQQAERYPSALFCLLIERNLGGAFFGGST